MRTSSLATASSGPWHIRNKSVLRYPMARFCSSNIAPLQLNTRDHLVFANDRLADASTRFLSIDIEHPEASCSRIIVSAINAVDESPEDGAIDYPEAK